MFGAIIGDIVGSIYERNNIKTKDFPLFGEHCSFTDDTVMTIAVAEALLNGGTSENFIDSLKKFGKLYPKAGYGGNFRSWLVSDSREPFNSWGNGSAMRVSPCAWFADSLDEAETLAEISAAVTHNHPEGIKGAQATAAAIYLARTGKKKAEIKEYIESRYKYELSRTLDEIRPAYKFNVSCQGSVPESIIAFLESSYFEDAIRNAISLGGDSDTIAAITGSIAEAAYGITERFEGMGYVNPPGSTLNKAYFFIDDTLATVINAWLDRGKPVSYFAKKDSWKIKPFSKMEVLKTDIRFNEKHFARLRQGLRPMQMEDKWFAYYDDGCLHFHRSWTGAKIYEARIEKDDTSYIISEISVERDPAIYSVSDDNEDVRSLHFLIGRGVLGLNIKPPLKSDDSDDVLRGWGSFGNLIL